MPNNLEDYLIISGMYRKQPAQVNDNTEKYVLSSYYCGAGIGRDRDTSGNNNPMSDGMDDRTGVKADNILFTIVFNADEFPGFRPALANNAPTRDAENELGFSLDYRVSTSCADVTLDEANTATG